MKSMSEGVMVGGKTPPMTDRLAASSASNRDRRCVMSTSMPTPALGHYRQIIVVFEQAPASCRVRAFLPDEPHHRLLDLRRGEEPEEHQSHRKQRVRPPVLRSPVGTEDTYNQLHVRAQSLRPWNERSQWSNLVCHYDEIKTSYSHQLD